ncbi:L-aspartate oxidase [Thiotrichales bacterium 19S9-12]|nr:L-aspartate oxidase [Thiotrichales bacterium 19S9-11]MCF6810883.1 L-aspartate oxidase [Thiotrichales bacterium 19S9-12]
MAFRFDIVIVGAGTSGLSAALKLAKDFKVAILCKSKLGEGSSLYAQGGIAAVMDQNDSLEAHIKDTLIAGDGLCDVQAVEYTVHNAKENIQWLINQGVEFTLTDPINNKQPYHLTREAGHSFRRILHSKDQTGKAVQTCLTSLAKSHRNIHIFEDYYGVDLIKHQSHCIGIYALNGISGKVETFLAKATILATGGASRCYLYSTNPTVASGDGIAMAYRSGARVANLEFNQFHPTTLYHPKAGSFLLSEALRGEGAYLKLSDGSRFMQRFDKRLELAPRDVVARAIDHEIKRLGKPYVYLDITHRSKAFIDHHFPGIEKALNQFNLSLASDLIPVVPAAHYTCGGVMVDQNAQTDILGLYAAGEVTYTGLHGANRMASNSLLECLVYADSAVKHIKKYINTFPDIKSVNNWDDGFVVDSTEAVFISHNWHELRHIMSNFMGIVRSNKRLQRAARRIKVLQEEVFEYYSDFKVTPDLIELRNLVLVAGLMIESARRRKESRGLHYTLDYPKSSERFLHPTILQPGSR